MHIFEEYANRHKIINNNIQYLSNSVVFTKDCPHKIIKIDKICNRDHADKFKILIIDSKEKKLNTIKQGFYDIGWDEYECFIVEKLNNFKNCICDNYEDVFISGWEIFVICNQDYFCEHVGLNTLYRSLDVQISKKERIKEIEDLIIKFELEKQGWDKIIKYIKNYSYWLANFINSLN